MLTIGPSAIKPNIDSEDTKSIWTILLSKVSIWIWLSIIIIWATGIYMMMAFGFRGPHVDAMATLALIMTIMTAVEYALTRRKFAAALGAGDQDAANQKLRAILRHGKIIFWLGVIAIAVASYGPF